MTIMQLTAHSWRARGNGPGQLLVPSLAKSWLGFRQLDAADAVTFELRVPGYRLRDLSIEVRDRVMIVRGERTEGWLKRRSRKSFVHTLSLPRALDEHGVDASFESGILRLKIAKKPYARRRLIPIQARDAVEPPAPRAASVAAVPRAGLGWLRHVLQKLREVSALGAARQPEA